MHAQERCADYQRQSLPCEVVDDRRDAQALAAGELVVTEVEALTLCRILQHRHGAHVLTTRFQPRRCRTRSPCGTAAVAS